MKIKDRIRSLYKRSGRLQDGALFFIILFLYYGVI